MASVGQNYNYNTNNATKRVSRGPPRQIWIVGGVNICNNRRNDGDQPCGLTDGSFVSHAYFEKDVEASPIIIEFKPPYRENIQSRSKWWRERMDRQKDC